MPLKNSVFEASKLVSTKTLLLKLYRRRQGAPLLRKDSHISWSALLGLGIPGPATEVIWAFRAESCKWSSKMGSQALPAPGPKKSKTESKKSQNRLFFNYFDSFSTLFWTFWAPGLKGPGTHFRTLLATFGPKGPNDPCSEQKFSQCLGGCHKSTCTENLWEDPPKY